MHKIYQDRMLSEGFELIDYAENDELVLTVWEKNGKSVFIETMVKRVKHEPNYFVMTKYEDCWSGRDSFKEVIKEVNEYINE